MKVALFVHCFFPTHYFGTESYTLSVAKELLALGHQPTVVTATLQDEPRQAALIDEHIWEGVPVLSIDKNQLPHRTVRETYDQPAMQRIHEDILRRLSPDIVHVCHLLSHTTALLGATAALKLPTVATLTDFFGFCYNNRLEAANGALCAGPNRIRSNCIACYLKAVANIPNKSALAEFGTHPFVRPIASQFLSLLGSYESRPLEIDGFRPSDLVARPKVLARAMQNYRVAVAPSQFLKQAYEKNGFPARIVLSNFGIDIDRASKPRRADELQIRLGFVGQIAPHKGAHILLEAMRRAARPNLSLTVWGPHDQDSSYFESLRSMGSGLPVSFPGSFENAQAATILADIDVLVIPATWYENSPLILLQALATHTPVIVSDVAGLTEFVHAGENGFHFPRGDVAALSRILQQIADNKGLLQRLGQRTRYPRTNNDMVKDLLSVYEQATESHQTR